MPSKHANVIIRTLQEILDIRLSPDQQLQCEEIVTNVYPGAAQRWINSWVKILTKRQTKVLTFDHFYKPIMNGIVVGGMRRPKGQLYRFDTSTKRMIYGTMHAYLGTDFTPKELEDIIWFTNFATLQELQTSIAVAQHHGVVNGAYVRAIIVGNRRRAAALLKAKDEKFKKVTDDPPNVLVGVPDVKSLQDAWTKRLKAAYDRATGQAVERGAGRKLQI